MIMIQIVDSFIKKHKNSFINHCQKNGIKKKDLNKKYSKWKKDTAQLEREVWIDTDNKIRFVH